MFVSHLELTDYRSYAQVGLDLGPGVTTFVGANGQGKTNLVEAVGYLATGRSHRVATDAPLVRRGAAQALIRARIDRGGRAVLVEIEVNPGRSNRARLNKAPVRPRETLGQVSRVLFCPEDLSLVKGDPSERRAFLDELLVGLAPRFDGVLSDLDRVLRQRNSLLKSASVLRAGGSQARANAVQTLSAWDEHLVALSSELTVARAHLVHRLAEPVVRRYRQVAPGEQDPLVGLRYQSGIPEAATASSRAAVADLARAALAARLDEELARGVTLVGPHRDELVLSLHDLPLRGYASHGESWSMALALRLASYDLLAGDAGPEGVPILVLDDVFAELDTGRRERLAEAVTGVEQVLITAAVQADVPAQLAGRTLRVAGGEVRDD